MAKQSANYASPAVKKKKKSLQSSTKTKRGVPLESTIDKYAVQCNACSKWRTLATEEEFEEYRSKLIEDPFVCKKLKKTTCKTPADINYDSSKTWVMDKPNIPIPPKGFKRVAVMRRDYSKIDVQYVAPDGTKIRSSGKMITYLDEHPEYSHLSGSDFSFSRPTIMRDTIPGRAKAIIKKRKKST